jgi:hypothetical protein
MVQKMVGGALNRASEAERIEEAGVVMRKLKG